MKVEESYSASPMAANGSGVIGTNGGTIGGFLCTTAGSLKVTYTNGAGATIVDTMAVAAGTFYPIPLAIASGAVAFATLTGGAAGTFFAN